MEVDGEAKADKGDQEYYPVALLVEELRHEDIEKRIHSIRSLAHISEALGQKRTRDELLPFLGEFQDDEDHVLVTLAEEIKKLVPQVGGAEYAYTLLAPLEEVASVDEVVVREAAVDALKEIACLMPADHISKHFCQLINRFSATDTWFTSKVSTCGLFGVALKRVNKIDAQNDLLNKFFELCQDSTPMVRRAAANALGEVAASVVEKDQQNRVLETFSHLLQDDQDSVRVLNVQNILALGRTLDLETIDAELSKAIRTCAEDPSWRVRYTVADACRQMCDMIPRDQWEENSTIQLVLDTYATCLQDQEAEVRGIASVRLADVVEVRPTADYLRYILPSLEHMINDMNMHVRSALGGSILKVAPLVGKQLTVDHVIPLALKFLRDEHPDVRLKIISTLPSLNSVIELGTMNEFLVNAVLELSEDPNWRVRNGLLEHTPLLAQFIDEQTFSEKFAPVCVKWLRDPVWSVREAAAVNLRDLTKVYGCGWAETHLLPCLDELSQDVSYLCRMAALTGIVALSEEFDPEKNAVRILPIFENLCSDYAPNVRFAVANSMGTLKNRVTPEVWEKQVLPLLNKLMKNDDDPDVQYFADCAHSAIEAVH